MGGQVGKTIKLNNPVVEICKSRNPASWYKSDSYNKVFTDVANFCSPVKYNAYGAVDGVSGELDSLILPHVNTEYTQLFLDEVAARHPQRRIVMVLGGAGWHRSAALKASPNMRLLALGQDPQRVQSIVTWDWIIDALMK